MHTDGLRPRGRSLLLELGALAIFAALAVMHTWPLAAAPGTYCRNDNHDTVLNEWTLAWVAHALATDPPHLFDGNIFYPEERTIAFSEHMFPQSVMAAPVRALGGSPVLAYNLALLAGFALTGWAFCHLVFAWTGSWGAGLVAGSMAAFNAHSFTRMGHLQALHLEFLPLALLALDRVLRAPRLRHALALAWWVALQALTSGYFLVFTAVSMMAAVLVRPAEWLRGDRRRALPFLAAAAGLAALLLLPFVLPYLRVRRELGLMRPLEDVAGYSASFGSYLLTTARPHWPWSQAFSPGAALFPGVLAALLAGTAVATGEAFKDRRARLWAAIAAATFCLSFGVRFPPYSFLYHALPLFEAIRNVARFGQFTLVALAVLAGFGAAWWLRRIQARAGRALLAALLFAVVQVESWHAPIRYVEFRGIPRIHKMLAGQEGVAAYFPFYAGHLQPLNAEYMLASTANWMPMLNGFSGFLPPGFLPHAENLARFPDARSIDYLRRVGVRFVVVDTSRYDAAAARAIDAVTDWRLWASDAAIRIYHLPPE